MNRKIVSLAVAALFSAPLFAQEMTVNTGRTTFGIRAGVNFQTVNGKDLKNDKLQNDLLVGYHAGVNAEIPVGTGSYLQPGVLYSVKGLKVQNSDTKVKINYLEVPVNFVYKPILGTGNMVLGFGPYLGIGLGGKVKDDNGNETDITFTNSTTVNNGISYRRLDGGANFLAGYEFSNRLSFQLNAQLGLVNINPEFTSYSNDKNRWRNTGWGVSVGYRF